MVSPVACIASVSLRGSSRKLGQEQQKMNDGGGGGERRNRLPANRMILKNCVRPRTQLLIGAGAGSVDYLAFETSIKPGMLWFRTSQIWSHLIFGSQITNALNWYLLESCLCEGLWDQSLQSIIEQWRLGKSNLLRITACGSDWKKWTVCWRQHQHKSEHRYSTLAKAAMDKRFVSFLKWKDSFCLLEF